MSASQKRVWIKNDTAKNKISKRIIYESDIRDVLDARMIKNLHSPLCLTSHACSEKSHYREESSSIYISWYKGCTTMHSVSSYSIITQNTTSNISTSVGSLSDIRGLWGESWGSRAALRYSKNAGHIFGFVRNRYKMRGCEKPDRTTHATRCDELRKKNLSLGFIHLKREHPLHGAVSTITMTFRPAGMDMAREGLL